MSGLANIARSVISSVTEVVSGLLSGPKQQQQQQLGAAVAPPPVEAPPVMPLADDKALLMQQRKSLASLVKTRGRASTILTADGSLGTPPEALGG